MIKICVRPGGDAKFSTYSDMVPDQTLGIAYAYPSPLAGLWGKSNFLMFNYPNVIIINLIMKIIKGVDSGQFPVKVDNTFTDYQNWYVIQTMSRSEQKLVSTLKVLLKNIHVYLPTRKVIHQLKGVQHIIELPLFPGYVFVYKNISEALDVLEKANSRIAFQPVMANGKYLEAYKNEMKFLFEVTGGNGVIELSQGVVLENEEVLIIQGPLKQLKGKILFIDKRKNKAKVRIEFMNRMLDISLGLEILSRPFPKVQ